MPITNRKSYVIKQCSPMKTVDLFFFTPTYIAALPERLVVYIYSIQCFNPDKIADLRQHYQ